MGGMVLEQRSQDELAGAISLGVLAERMVLALGRAVRGDNLLPNDTAVLEDAKRLFELMTESDVIVIDSLVNRMLTDESYLDALRVVRLDSGDNEIEASARRYVELLGRVLDGTIEEQERDELARLRNLFVHVGEKTLSRANELSRTRQESSWQPMQQPILRF